jgi:hypothetical protein
VKSNTAFKTPIHFEGRVKYFFSGYNRNDLIVNGNIRYALKNYLSVKAYVLYSLTEPGYTQQYFTVKNGAGWNNNFGKQNQLTAGGTVYSPKIGLGAEVYNTILCRISFITIMMQNHNSFHRHSMYLLFMLIIDLPLKAFT